MENSCFEKGETETLANEGQASSPSNKKEEDKPSEIGPNEPEKITLEQAAIIVQAFFRGYQVLVLVSLLLCMWQKSLKILLAVLREILYLFRIL